jgi:hypothetical protein
MWIVLTCVLGAASIGSDLQLFVDDAIVEHTENVVYELHSPEPREAVLRFDKPWEGWASAYMGVFKDGERFRCYYRGLPAEQGAQVTCTAESSDGITWTKPELGLIEVKGSKANNVVWSGEGSHNFFVFVDANPAAAADAKYKAIGGEPLLAFASADGYSWRKLREEPIYTEKHFDSLNTALWNPIAKRYECFMRDAVEGVRAIRMATSDDFLSWSAATPLEFGDAPVEHLYTNAITPYFRAPSVYFGFPKRFLPDRLATPPLTKERGVSDAVFMSSRDGVHWKRWQEAFIRPGLDQANWTHRNNMVAHGLVETGVGEISLYVSQHYEHPTGFMRRFTIRTDGFVSLSADARGGTFLTKPFTFNGRELVLNYSTSAAGSIRVEIEGEDGKAVPAYAMSDCDEIYGDHIERVVTWVGDPNTSTFGSRAVRLKFQMKDADVFSFRFR